MKPCRHCLTLVVTAEELRKLWREVAAIAFVLILAALACGAFD